MSGNLKEKTLIGLGVGLGASALGGLYYWYKAHKLNAYPKTWKRVGTLSNLTYCPIKSCAVVRLNEAICGNLGIEEGQCRDHMFMLVEDTNKVVTARTYPQMMKIQQELSGKILTVTAPNMEPLDIDFGTIGEGDSIKANIFGQDVFVVECGSKYDKWFSRFIQDKEEGLRLVYYPYPEPTKIIVDKTLKNGIFSNNDTGTLQDVSSYMLINQQSVDELNTRLKRPITAAQFRPNFIVETEGPAYDEDHWKWVQIGNDAVFRVVCPCYRCILPNINPATAERDPDCEPLQTLNSYRCDGINKSPVMGLQLGLRTPGVVRIGDDVFVGV